MNIIIKETGATATLELYKCCQVSDKKKNIAGKFAKKHAGLKHDKPARAKGVKEYTMTQATFDEWSAIMSVAQANLALRAKLDNTDGEYVHGLIEHEVKELWRNAARLRQDNMFVIKNTVDAENAMWKRLVFGVVSIREPIEHTGAGYGEISKTMKFVHERSTIAEHGQDWLMQVEAGFRMNMIDDEESFDFTAGAQVGFYRSTGQTEITHDCEEEWIFPFSMTREQETVVLDACWGAAHYRLHGDANC